MEVYLADVALLAWRIKQGQTLGEASNLVPRRLVCRGVRGGICAATEESETEQLRWDPLLMRLHIPAHEIPESSLTPAE